ncbi:hypothetical protein RQP46_008040 [Phenoliferia psychrophenolica]
MAASVTDQLQHLELSPVAAPSHSESNPLGEGKTTPTLPPELVADIIDLTTEILVEEERHLASQLPLTNHFLLSAALVNRTWHSIASPALLKNSLVTPNAVEEFLAQIEQRGMKETLDRVRFGAGAVELANDRPSTEGADDTPLLLLLNSLPHLASLELVGIGLHLSSDLKRLPRFRHLVFSNMRADDLRMSIKAFASAPTPTRLTIIETRACDQGDPNWMAEVSLFSFLVVIPEIYIYSIQMSAIDYVAAMIQVGSDLASVGMGSLNRLRSVSLEYTQARQWIRVSQYFSRNPLVNSHFPALTTLSMYLGPLHFFATTGNRPSLTSVHVLEGDPDKESYTIEGGKKSILEIVDKLPVLRSLKVPACLRSEAVEEACEAKGIELRWT